MEYDARFYDTIKRLSPVAEARKLGAIAYISGGIVGDNPYTEEDDDLHWAWMEGWILVAAEK